MCKLVENREELFTEEFQRIILCQHENITFRRNNEAFEKIRSCFPNVELISGLPDTKKLKLTESSVHSLVIIDDLQRELLDSHEMLTLLSVETHHSSISVIITLQASTFCNHSLTNANSCILLSSWRIQAQKGNG